MGAHEKRILMRGSSFVLLFRRKEEAGKARSMGLARFWFFFFPIIIIEVGDVACPRLTKRVSQRVRPCRKNQRVSGSVGCVLPYRACQTFRHSTLMKCRECRPILHPYEVSECQTLPTHHYRYDTPKCVSDTSRDVSKKIDFLDTLTDTPRHLETHHVSI